MPVDVASLVYFRIVFGALMLAEVINWSIRGQIYSYYIQPSFHFKYYGFEWIPLLPAMGMYLLLLLLRVLAFFIMVRFLYRISAILFFLGFTNIFILDQAFYYNHLYLIVLLSFLMIFVPAHLALSVDAALQQRIHTDAVRAWALWVLRAQIGIVYFYAGLAKLMSNDWLHGV